VEYTDFKRWVRRFVNEVGAGAECDLPELGRRRFQPVVVGTEEGEQAVPPSMKSRVKDNIRRRERGNRHQVHGLEQDVTKMGNVRVQSFDTWLHELYRPSPNASSTSALRRKDKQWDRLKESTSFIPR